MILTTPCQNWAFRHFLLGFEPLFCSFLTSEHLRTGNILTFLTETATVGGPALGYCPTVKQDVPTRVVYTRLPATRVVYTRLPATRVGMYPSHAPRWVCTPLMHPGVYMPLLLPGCICFHATRVGVPPAGLYPGGCTSCWAIPGCMRGTMRRIVLPVVCERDHEAHSTPRGMYPGYPGGYTPPCTWWEYTSLGTPSMLHHAEEATSSPQSAARCRRREPWAQLGRYPLGESLSGPSFLLRCDERREVSAHCYSALPG